jgi:microcystin-dependent protein
MSQPFVGQLALFGFNFAPVGWLPCNGSLLPISQYDVLFALIGTTYGGDGVNTFALPDLRGRVPVHVGGSAGPGLQTWVLGERLGSETVTLTSQQLPSHNHNLTAATASPNAVPSAIPGPTVTLAAGGNGLGVYAPNTTGATAEAMNANALSPVGGNQPHENRMPTTAMNYCIAWAGIFPSQN